MGNINKFLVSCSILIAALFFTGCDSGGGSSSTSTTNPNASPLIISGVENDASERIGTDTLVGTLATKFHLTGINFGLQTQDSVVVFLDKKYRRDFFIADIEPNSWSDTKITVHVPQDIVVDREYSLVIKNSDGKLGESQSHTVRVVSPQKPQLLKIDQTASFFENDITIVGKNFGKTKNEGKIIFKTTDKVGANGIEATTISFWNDSKIIAKIPNGLTNNTPYYIFIKTTAGESRNSLIYTPLSSENNQTFLKASIEYVEYTESNKSNYLGNYLITLECQMPYETGDYLDKLVIKDANGDTITKKQYTGTLTSCPKVMKILLDIKKPGYITISSSQFVNPVRLYAAEVYTNMYALFIGVSTYQNGDNLRFAHTDAIKMNWALMHSNEDPLNDYQIWKKNLIKYHKILINDEAKKDLIISEINQIVNQANNQISDNINSVVFIYFAGHGGYDEESFICPYDFGGFLSIWRYNEITDSELYGILDKLDKKIRKVIIIDACQSGGFIGKSALSENNIMSYKKLEKLPNLISGFAAGSDHSSLEYSKEAGGIFTHFITEGLGTSNTFGPVKNESPSDNNINIEKLLWYAQNRTMEYIAQYYYNYYANPANGIEPDEERNFQHPQIYVNYDIGDLPIKGKWDITPTTP